MSRCLLVGRVQDNFPEQDLVQAETNTGCLT